MRRWEFSGDGSGKFWEVGQDGTTVTVRFGRLGSAGRIKTKELASADAAAAHVAKLVSEKEKKGYLAAGAAPAAAPPITVPPPPVPDVAPPELPGETTWSVPAAWRRVLHPRRDGAAVTPRKIDPEAGSIVDTWINDVSDELYERLDDSRSDQGIVTAVRAWLRDEADPLGAAATAALAIALRHGREGAMAFPDAWITRHGLAFAAEAVAEMTRVVVSYSTGQPDKLLQFSDPAKPSPYRWEPGSRFADHVRAVLANASDEEYETAVEALAPHRVDGFQRMVVSFLVPTRQDWVEEVCSEQRPTQNWAGWTRWILCCAGTPEQVELLRERGYLGFSWQAAEVLYSMADAIGPALAPVLAYEVDQDLTGGDARKIRLKMLLEIPTDEAFGFLLDRLDQKHVQPVVVEAMRRYPVRALRMLPALVSAGGKSAGTARQLLLGHILAHPGLVDQVAGELPKEVRDFLEEFTAENKRLPEAPAEKLPPLLVDPPWLKKRNAAKAAVIKGLAVPAEDRLMWTDEERESWRDARVYYRPWPKDTDWSDALEKRRLNQLTGYQGDGLLIDAPAELIRPLLAGWSPRDSWYAEGWIKRATVRFGAEALSFALPLAVAHPTTTAEALLPFLSGGVATAMADWLVRLKSVRPVAVAWLTRHGVEAARLLIPAALGPGGPRRRNAETALMVLNSAGRAGEVTEAAADYGPEAEAAIADLLATDPLDLLPAKIPAVGPWAEPGLLPQILLRDKESALPAESTRHALTIASLCKPGEKYAGIDVLIEACDPVSLSEFAWAVFQRWQASEMPSKDSWALTVLGWLGDDDTVRRLAPLIRAWPGEGGHQRAVAGLDVLAQIGTDTALMHLNGISQKVKFKGLKVRAQEKMADVAAELGLSAEQLADRLVPSFGLDEDASLVVDYGPRRFVVGFDEQLKPFVADEDGKRRKDLPKPGARDDQELAPAEYKRFTLLKKDVRTIAADQILRLEQAMVTERRWTAAEFRDLLAGHPLLWHIARRLVWLSITDDGTTAFRLAEDRTLADVHDDEFTLPDTAEVALAHPLRLGDSLGEWGALFADYEILQPFHQLGRPVLAFTADERDGHALKRFEQLTVNVGKVLGLQKRGWERAQPQDSGCEPWISKPVGDGRAVVINLDPGIIVGMVTEFPEQRLQHIWLNNSPDGNWAPKDPLRFGELDALTASELLADLTELTS
jgi:predicted DNA-binding WGR domain protein